MKEMEPQIENIGEAATDIANREIVEKAFSELRQIALDDPKLSKLVSALLVIFEN